MTQGIWHCLQFMLEHISTIIERYPITVGDYVYGQQVKCIENRDIYNVITTGRICGFEYFDDDSHDDVGLFYQVKVESGQAIFKDGTVRSVASDVIERIHADNVHAIDNLSPLLKTEVTV